MARPSLGRRGAVPPRVQVEAPRPQPPVLPVHQRHAWKRRKRRAARPERPDPPPSPCPPGRCSRSVRPRFLLAGCSLDYEEAVRGGAGRRRASPTRWPSGVVHKIHKDGRLSLRAGGRAGGDVQRAATRPSSPTRTSWSSTPRAKPPPRAARDRVVFHSDTENAEISGAVHVHSASEKGDVTAESLSWENKTQDAHRAARGDGEHPQGRRLLALGQRVHGDFRTREVTFSRARAGHLCLDEKK